MTKQEAVKWVFLRAYDETGPREITKRYKVRGARLLAFARSSKANRATAFYIYDGLAAALCELGHLRSYPG